MATTNPFEQLGLIASQAPQLQAAQSVAPAPVAVRAAPVVAPAPVAPATAALAAPPRAAAVQSGSTTLAAQPSAASVQSGSAALATAPRAALSREGTATTARAQQVGVDAAKQTVQGQLAGILASGNPLLVQAQTRARQQAQQRGLLNTSMGVQAGEEALYGAALPIAQGDVDVYNRQAFTNAELAQQAELANQQARNQMEQLNVQESGVTGRFNVEAAQRAELANQQARNEMERLNVQEAGTTGRFNVEAAQRAELENQQARNQMAQLNLQEAGTTSRFAAGEAGATGRFNVEAAQRTELENAQMQQQTAIENARLQQQAATQQGENQMRLMLQQMDATTRTDLVNIEANYRTLMQASASASDLYQQTLRNISDITANKDMNAEAKNASISQQKELLQNGMNLIGSMNNIGVSQLLDFSAGGASGVTAAPVDEMRTTQPVPDRYTGLSLYDTARG